MDSTSGDEGTSPMKLPPKDSLDLGESHREMSEADTITHRHGVSGSDSKPPSLPPKNRPQSSTSAEKSTIDQNASPRTVQRNYTGTSWHGTGTIPLTRATNDHDRPLDWIGPVNAQQPGRTTVSERLAPTLEMAKSEERKYSNKAKLTGWSLNIAIGLQVVISSLITGLSAVTTGRQTQVMTSILGGVGTVIASYLARARGSNEPELSISRVKDLQKFIRECTAFTQDHGYETGHEYDDRIEEFRSEFEGLLGNGSG
ncbi:hypothetical protein BD410DRAFT_787844 [Rickenella mellea]|uniref:SMODS and SLOG-associating 2TM effector domain-containing protein n=1 Tax=Rickenella mellea TaxID=50990 RepID=A0A4Y7Q729_9AGAM|nr:hypothetical protein BD410DRAFT_787844 [Rickenella mellea]